ncbi:MAG TPA: ABC transporter permease [Casimicrobiaceae bacterium]|nr:ABC transporter permease [Casimicrobiaceae bacterium]
MTRAGQRRLVDWSVNAIVVIVCCFMVLPTLIVVPISFSSADFISFPPVGFSLRWYDLFFTSRPWQHAAANSLIVATGATLLATVLGTLASLGAIRLAKSLATPITMSFLLPLMMPSIVTAIALYRGYAYLRLSGTVPGLILSHAILGLPFVVINVSAALQKMDWRAENAARSLGASPARAFFLVVLPAIRPGIVAGAAFAFLTSFDDVVVALFMSGIDATTLPVQMWNGIRFEISPAVAAVSTILLVFSCGVIAIYFTARGITDHVRRQ